MAGDCRCLFQRSIAGKISENHEFLSQDSSWVRIPTKMFYVRRKLNTMEKRLQDQSYFFRRGYYGSKDHNSENLSWVRVSVNMVSVALKLSTI
jgi:hypothetical protein